jgi:hypothetical protein
VVRFADRAERFVSLLVLDTPPVRVQTASVGMVMSWRVLVEESVARIRREIPEAVAVFLGGSVVRGDPGPFSDVDFDVVVPDGPRDDYPEWIVPYRGRLVVVSLWIRDVDRWLWDAEQAQDWAFRLRCADPLQLCWVAESWRSRLERTHLTHPAGEPEFGHFLGELGKVANAYHGNDELGLRLAAHELAVSCPSLLQPLNPSPPATSRREAIETALAVPVAPAGYRADLMTCLGLSGLPTTVEDIYAAATRLASGVVDLLESNAAAYAGLPHADWVSWVRDGSLRAYLNQLLGYRHEQYPGRGDNPTPRGTARGGRR